MQLDVRARGYVAAARATLDEFDVASRLEHVREFVWRGGHLRFDVAPATTASGLPHVWYELTAAWPAPVLAPATSADVTEGLVPATVPVVEGRWRRGTAGYTMRIGIEPGVPSALYLRADRTLSFVPFLRRPRTQVEQALARDLTAYVEAFLATLEPVPLAMARATARLHELGL